MIRSNLVRKQFVVTIEVPITNYDGTEVFFACFMFHVSPTKQEFIAQMYELDTYAMIITASDEIQQHDEVALEAIEIAKLIPDSDWRILSGSLCGTNTFVNHPKFGKQPFSWNKRMIL